MNGKLFTAICAVIIAAPALAGGSHYVRGYTRSNGTYVAPHYQTNPDSTRLNNWSTIGNVNPYTGKPGTVDPYKAQPSTSANPWQAPASSDDSEPK